MRKSSITLGFRSTRQPSNKEGWYQAASKETNDDKQCTERLKAYTPVRPHHGAICGHGGRAAGGLQDLPDPQRLPHLLHHDPKQYIKHVSRIRDKSQRYARIRGAVSTVDKRPLVAATVEKTKSTPSVKVIGKGALHEEALCAIQQSSAKTATWVSRAQHFVLVVGSNQTCRKNRESKLTLGSKKDSLISKLLRSSRQDLRN